MGRPEELPPPGFTPLPTLDPGEESGSDPVLCRSRKGEGDSSVKNRCDQGCLQNGIEKKIK